MAAHAYISVVMLSVHGLDSLEYLASLDSYPLTVL